MAHVDRHFEHLDPQAIVPSTMLFEKARMVCMSLAFIGAVVAAVGWAINPQQFYYSYLSSWAFCWTTMAGVLFFVMLHYLVDAGWDTVIRRPAEQLLGTMPIIVLGMVPILIGMLSGQLYPWVHGKEHIDGFRGWFLSMPVVLTSLVFYAAVWLRLSYVLRRNSIMQDRDGAAKWTLSSRKWSAGGIILYALTFSFCSFHLLMSLDPHWYSTIFGVYLWTGGVVGGLAVMTLITLSLRRGVLRQYIGSDTIHDIGKLTFAFNCFWAYIAFSQYFLIWYGNIPEETIWFLRRWTGEGTYGPAQWWIIGTLFPIGMFLAPFLVLMSAVMKRNGKVLAAMCVVMLVAHWLEMIWFVQPELRIDGVPRLAWAMQWAWIDLAVLCLLGGSIGMVFIRLLRKASLVPVMDPRLVEALSAEHVEEIEQADVE